MMTLSRPTRWVVCQVGCLVIQNVGAKCANLARVERLDKCGLVHAEATAQIDRDWLFLHLGELLGIEIMVVRLVKGSCD